MAGALAGLKIVEMAGIGPAPFAAMMLADHGAEVVRIARPGSDDGTPAAADILSRSRTTLYVDIKRKGGVDMVMDLLATTDGLIEGFRPGVMERLGLDPQMLLERNPRLVCGRMTGWGQEGPYALRAGHDINYIALAGALHICGRAGDKPTPPANMLGDFGGGGMLLAFGMVAGLLRAQISGVGQVIDCAMIDGSALLASMIWGLRGAGVWNDERGTNALDTGAPFYEVYETADGGFVSVGAIEPQFYATLRRKCGLDADPSFDEQWDREAWPALKAKLAHLFKAKTRSEWSGLLENEDACYAPVLTLSEVPEHPHVAARGTMVKVDGVDQPAPAPRFGHTPALHPDPRRVGNVADTLRSFGLNQNRIDALLATGVV